MDLLLVYKGSTQQTVRYLLNCTTIISYYTTRSKHFYDLTSCLQTLWNRVWILWSRIFCFWTLCSRGFVSELCAAEFFSSLNSMDKSTFSFWTLWSRALIISEPYGTGSFFFLNSVEHIFFLFLNLWNRFFSLWILWSRVLFVFELFGSERSLFLIHVEQNPFRLWSVFSRALLVAEWFYTIT